MNGVLKDKEVLARQIGQKPLSFEAFFKCTCRGAGREKTYCNSRNRWKYLWLNQVDTGG